MGDKNIPRKPRQSSVTGQVDIDEAGTSSRNDVMYRFVDDFFTSFDMLNLSVFEDTWKLIPSVSMKNDRDKIVIDAEIPGMSASEIEIILKSGVLVITGGRKSPAPETESSSVFRKVIQIPSCIEPDKIRATYKDGLLSIILPKCGGKAGSRLRIPVRRSGKVT